MQKSTKILAFALAIGITLAGGVFVNDSLASQDAEKQIMKVTSDYLQAMKTGNVNEVVKHIKDLRFPDEATKKAKFEKYVKQSTDIVDTQVLSVNVIDDSQAEATFQLTDKNQKSYELKLPLINEDGKWLLLIDGTAHVKRYE